MRLNKITKKEIEQQERLHSHARLGLERLGVELGFMLSKYNKGSRRIVLENIIEHVKNLDNYNGTQ